MKILVVMSAAALAIGASSDSSRILYPVEPIDHRSLACGCTFNAAGAAPAGSFYTGPELLVLDPYGEPSTARVNLGEGNILLRPAQPIVLPLYQCAAGETWISEWHSERVSVRAELRALRPGEESCWFEGNVVATLAGRSESVPINGACGC